MSDLPEGFEFSSDPTRVDREVVHQWLSEEAYWSLGRSRATQDAAIDGSRNYGVYRSRSGQQMACARVVTDGVTFAWLCDVFVHPSVRGLGVGTALLTGIIAELDELRLRRILLATADAHALYTQFGFEPLTSPQRWMAKVLDD